MWRGSLLRLRACLLAREPHAARRNENRKRNQSTFFPDQSLRATRAFSVGSGRERAQVKVDVEKEFKSKMNSLYKLVHPDLFHNYPEAKEANEKSFKLLQQFISDSNTQYGDKRADMFHFSFYLKKAGEGLNGTSSSDALEKINIELQQPRYMTGWVGKDTGINPELTPALNKLLKACGLDTIDVFSSYESSKENFNVNYDDSNLKDFLPYAVDSLLKGRNSETVERLVRSQQLDMMRSTIRMFRGLTVTFSQKVSRRYSAEKMTCLNDLVRLLDKDKALDLRGIRFVLDEEFKVSPLGAIHVDIRALSGKKGEWSEYLSATRDLAVARVRSNFVEGIRIYEDKIATELGIASLHCSCKISHSEECKHFLDLLLQRVKSERVFHTDTCKAMKLIVDRREDFEISQRDGTVVIPVSKSVDQVVSYLKGSVSEALLITWKYEKELKELDRLKYLVRSRLKLRIYSKDDRVTLHQFRQCSNRLVRMSKSLVTLTEGLNLRVSEANRLHDNSIDIAWDFAA